ncbi:hypothetical protein [Sphingomonas sp. Y38-1Y]|uniref:hypothetical protein n=1 Tax=Sphingomonas sp. Y38-1Y TaxID=3078265 RepID=UPI0028E3D31A|nr:hypothetical protein [Sphingomonas sp. Y38-1Y]
MSFLSDAAAALKNVVLMQSSIERLERTIERQDRDIAGLRDAMSMLRERLVRVETIIDEARADARSRRALPED